MPIYPIRIDPLVEYGGDDPKKRRAYEHDVRIAEIIEECINELLETEHRDRPSVIITYGTVAANLSLDEKAPTNTVTD